MSKNILITAEEITKQLGVSKPYAYKLIQDMNKELREKGYTVISGRTNRKYYEERFYYGIKEDEVLDHE